MSEVTDIIIQQIRYADKWAFGAWGSKNFFADKNKLQFRVSCPKLKGIVEIEYREVPDLYWLSFWKKKKGMFEKIKEFDNIYCDQLVSVIDVVVG